MIKALQIFLLSIVSLFSFEASAQSLIGNTVKIEYDTKHGTTRLPVYFSGKQIFLLTGGEGESLGGVALPARGGCAIQKRIITTKYCVQMVGSDVFTVGNATDGPIIRVSFVGGGCQATIVRNSVLSVSAARCSVISGRNLTI